MKRFACCIPLMLVIMWSGVGSLAWGQGIEMGSKVPFWKRSLNGPRMGFTIIPGESELHNRLESMNVGRVISQFGWHFEHQVLPSTEGPSFVIEWVPLIGGVEYGMFIPALTLAFGIRLPDGYEFGLGPNLLIGGENGVNSALVIAVGKTFNFNGVNIPVNIAYVTSPMGSRIGFIFGYAVQQ
jgi:hypothetical protein